VLTLTAASAALAAPGTTGRRQSSGSGQRLDTRTQQAVLSLYALDSRLQAWRARVASLEAAAAALQQRSATLRDELGAARTTLHVSQHQLGLNLRTLYERGNVDPVAVMLGATSLTNGIQQLDDLSRVADESRRIVAATTAAQGRLTRSRLNLAAEARRLARSLAAARQAEREVASTAAARAAYVSSLRARQHLQATQVNKVVATAHTAEQKTRQLQPKTAPAPPPAAGGRKLVVSATCYDLPGRTATGMPVGRGVVAVDPSVIPLGSRLYIPGYGDGIAADVGGGIRGNIIDLWFPTYAECAAWGRRTVTITVY
jgi:3D (Asp-Asp-Asp) domain-containing protein